MKKIPRITVPVDLPLDLRLPTLAEVREWKN